jgi:hypothetical protein
VWQASPRTSRQEPDWRDFQVVAFEREPLLILFSDVLASISTEPHWANIPCLLCHENG